MFFNGKYRVLQKMNYISDQQGIIERYLKEAEGWNTHLEKTKNAIIQSAEKKGNGSCAILGAGWLLDVPIEFLTKYFKHVYLFDVVHPTQIRHKMHKFKNVTLVEQDITGGAINEFFESVQMHKSMGLHKSLDEFKFNGFNYKMQFDFVASVNILNQLDILLVDYLKGYCLYSEEELMQLRVSIQQKHFDTMPKGKTSLITDYEELVFGNENNLEKTSQLIHIVLPEEKIVDRWQWQFDHQDYCPGKNVIFNVLAMEI
jgi:hypothetical protein